ncbi:putative reverse transcriptase domain-containing protein [Tanacetum coccineum]
MKRGDNERLLQISVTSIGKGVWLLFKSRRLFQQYVVTVLCAIEQNRLDYIRKHQNDLRSDYLSGLYDAVSKGDHEGIAVGSKIMLPSTFTGGPRLVSEPKFIEKPDYTPASPDYSPASNTEFDPSEDPSSDHVPPLPATSPFLSSTDDSSDNDIPDTPPLLTHDTPFTETTLSTQRSPAASGALRLLSETSSDSPVDALSDSASSHSSSDHSLPVSSSALSTESLSPPPPHTATDLRWLRCGGVILHRRSQAEKAELIAYAMSRSSLRDIDAAIDMCVCVHFKQLGLLSIAMWRADDIPEPAQEGAVEVTYETLGDLVQRFHDHTEEIAVHRVQLERDNRRLRDIVDVASQRVTRSQLKELRVQRELR